MNEQDEALFDEVERDLINHVLERGGFLSAAKSGPGFCYVQDGTAVGIVIEGDPELWLLDYQYASAEEAKVFVAQKNEELELTAQEAGSILAAYVMAAKAA